MLKNRISLRLATAAGTAAVVVSGAAFGYSAFADTGAPSDQAAAAAVLPDDAAATTDGAFFPQGEERSQEARQALLEEAETRRDQAVNAGVAGAEVSLAEEEEEEEEIPVPTGGGGGGGGDAKATARAMLADHGWSEDQFGCLDALWEKESNWNHTAQNPSSGAYGIPQALPGSKMASAGSDWQTNPATQIKWGLGYIEGRYGSPCAAWEHSQNVGWY